MQCECLLRGGGAHLQARVRFLHLLERTAGGSAPWPEAVEREVAVDVTVAALLAGPFHAAFAFAGREHQGVEGEVELSATEVGEDLARLTLRVLNRTPLAVDENTTRDQALLHGLVSTHAILRATGGGFVSLLDPPEDCRQAAQGCRHVGAWPVLAGPAGSSDTALCSPIILYDHPEVAPESPGDLFDATEIDEILTLRILTLTDQEKRELRAGDDRARRLLERTEALAREQLLALHGTMRHVRTPPKEREP
jgi:hypothetical protein